jgi:hypothetical protein
MKEGPGCLIVGLQCWRKHGWDQHSNRADVLKDTDLSLNSLAAYQLICYRKVRRKDGN